MRTAPAQPDEGVLTTFVLSHQPILQRASKNLSRTSILRKYSYLCFSGGGVDSCPPRPPPPPLDPPMLRKQSRSTPDPPAKRDLKMAFRWCAACGPILSLKFIVGCKECRLWR